ncbi:Hsp33 family molecular chaperone HslO [Alteromonas sp. a30]|uniref:Hsp33 family molecular chaperone HslO n=1 Tax=Alteromonas sp. a30 TaxID=2730917 RepID=UPI00227F06AB|nr:Hsp33 family molecular chaperone HslO [Alteromonas sp. a30]MCY7295675.1 Hsp33 family molecular chaperone HslO [Alteromonas sp. a30]
MSTQKTDQLHRFLFSEAHIRGELVQLSESVKAMLDTKAYPPCLQTLLSEMMLATSLLTATLKFEGEISLQLQCEEGALKYALINGNHQQQLRGIARWDGELSDESFSEIVGKKGVLAITIMPKKGQQYQGIVALDKPSLAECLKGYFEQSEQLATEIVLHTLMTEKEVKAAGMLLQALPQSDTSHQKQNDTFEHVAHLTKTITKAEITELPVEEILHRLYHQEEVRLFDPVDVSFSCTCSQEKVNQAIASLPTEEVRNLLDERGKISTSCQYCFAEYKFTEEDFQNILGDAQPNSSKLH